MTPLSGSGTAGWPLLLLPLGLGVATLVISRLQRRGV